MISVDDRVGSRELEKPLRALGCSTRLERLPYADFAFQSHDGLPIGIELKAIGDLLNCIESRRLTDHQLPGLLSYYSRVYLIVEGMYRPSSDGLLEIYRGSWSGAPSGRRWMYASVDNFLTSLEEEAGVKLRRTSTRAETAFCIKDLWGRWQKREHSAITTHTGVETPEIAIGPRPLLVHRWSKELPGIGVGKFGGVARHFGTARALALAGPEEWQGIKGVGEKTIAKIQEALDGLE